MISNLFINHKTLIFKYLWKITQMKRIETVNMFRLTKFRLFGQLLFYSFWRLFKKLRFTKRNSCYETC